MSCPWPKELNHYPRHPSLSHTHTPCVESYYPLFTVTRSGYMEMQFSIECRKYYDILFFLLHYPLCPVQKRCDTLSTNQMRNLKSIVAWSFAFSLLLWQFTYIHFEITWVHVPFSLVFFWSYIVIKLVQFCSVTTYHTGHLADHHDKCCHAAVISHISLRWALYQTFRCFRAIQFGSDLTRKWMAGYIRRTHSWKRSGKKIILSFSYIIFYKTHSPDAH